MKKYTKAKRSYKVLFKIRKRKKNITTMTESS